MKIYNYHPEYNFFLVEASAFESPREPGVFLIPAYATDIEPPRCDLAEIQIFNGTSWDIVEDKRGIYYSITNPSEIIDNQNPLEFPPNCTKKVPPEVPEGYNLTWNDGWVLEEIPPPPELTPEEKLMSAGLSIEELKIILGINT